MASIRWLAVVFAAIGIASAAQCVPFRTPKQPIAESYISQAASNSQQADQELEPANSAVRIDPPQENASKAQSNATTNTETLLAWFTGALVVVGLIQAVILGFTIAAINRQTSSYQNSERAWMVVLIERAVIPHSHGITIIRFSVRCMNNGKTPAFLLETGHRGMVLPRGQALPPNPPPCNPESVNKWEGNGLPLQPKSYIVRHDFDTVSPDPERIYKGDDFLWIYGYIRYRDAFGKPRETGYCLLWDNMHDNPDLNHGEDEFLPWGPASYHRAT